MTALSSTIVLPNIKVTKNLVSAPAAPGRTLDNRHPSFVESNEAKSLTLRLPSNLKELDRGADSMSIRFGFSYELVLVNSALPSGSPVLVDQLRSRKGSLTVPLR